MHLTRNTVLGPAIAGLAVVGLAVPVFAQAGGVSNAVADGDFSAPATWDANGVPDGTADGLVANGFTVTSSTDNSAFRIRLGDDPSGSTGTLTITGGTLGTDRAVSIGGFGAGTTGTGILNLEAGGTINVGLVGPGGVQDISVGDNPNTTGILNANGGTAEVAGFITAARNVDSTGTINQSDGILNAVQLRIADQGTAAYNLSGGTVNLTGLGANFQLGVAATGSGTGTQSAGTINTANVSIGNNGSGTYTMTGGAINQNDPLGFFIVGGLGVDGNGSFTQSAGVVSVGADARVGNGNDSTGEATLSGTATFDVAGTLHVASALGAAGNPAAGVTGSLNIEGAGVTLTADNLDGNGADNTANINWIVEDGGVSAIQVASTVDLDTVNLDVNEALGEVIAPGTVLTLIDAGSISGTFADASLLYDFTVTSGGANGTVLQATKLADVPEPASMTLLSMGGLALLGRRRR